MSSIVLNITFPSDKRIRIHWVAGTTIAQKMAYLDENYGCDCWIAVHFASCGSPDTYHDLIHRPQMCDECAEKNGSDSDDDDTDSDDE